MRKNKQMINIKSDEKNSVDVVIVKGNGDKIVFRKILDVKVSVRYPHETRGIKIANAKKRRK